MDETRRFSPYGGKVPAKAFSLSGFFASLFGNLGKKELIEKSSRRNVVDRIAAYARRKAKVSKAHHDEFLRQQADSKARLKPGQRFLRSVFVGKKRLQHNIGLLD